MVNRRSARIIPTLAAMGALAVTACGTPAVNTNITRNPQYAKVRVVDLQPTDSGSFYVMLPDEIPLDFTLSSVAPGASGFGQQVVGSWTGYVAKDEKTLSSATQTAAAGQIFSAFITATGTASAPVVNWTSETFTPNDQAQVRFVSGITGLQSGAVTVGSATMPGGLDAGVPSDWLSVAPGTTDVSVSLPDGTTATYAGATLSAGELRTFLLAPGQPPTLSSFKDGESDQPPTLLTKG